LIRWWLPQWWTYLHHQYQSKYHEVSWENSDPFTPKYPVHHFSAAWYTSVQPHLYNPCMCDGIGNGTWWNLIAKSSLVLFTWGNKWHN
jgi:hypothetical protein